MKSSRRSVLPMEFHIPRMFSSNSGATKPIKKSQIAKAKGKHQFVHSTFSAAIEGGGGSSRAHDLRIQREMEARARAGARATTPHCRRYW